jgi:outer membrane murein-binding lipoprotein Lpp
MSRPPNHNTNNNVLCSAYSNNRNGLIDFVNTPMSLNQPYMDESIYAQAGFPGYPAPLGAAYQPMYGHPMPPPMPLAAPAYLQPPPEYLRTAMPPVETEAVLHQRIDEKIDAIIQAQKEHQLNSKIDSLNSKVEQLTHNLASNAHISSHLSYPVESSDAAHIHRLSSKVEQLSQSLEVANEQRRLQAQFDRADSPRVPAAFMKSPFADQSLHISSEPSDAEISRRLRRLAAESSMRQQRSDCKIPDW